VSTAAPRRPFPLLGLGIGVTGHAIAWALYFLLSVVDEPGAGVPAWAQLALHHGGPELILAVFSLASMLPLTAGVQEVMNDGRPRLARVLGLLCAALAAALAWRWYGLGRPFLCSFAVLTAIPGLLGPAPPRPPTAPPDEPARAP